MIARLQIGEPPWGLSLVRFTLTYDGDLRASGRPKHKWEIRQKLSPQLAELWEVSPAIRYVRQNRWVARKGSFGKPIIHHSAEKEEFPGGPPPTAGDWLDTCSVIAVEGRNFLPLVRGSLALHCGLKILFMRKEEPGRLVFQGGDIDNRLKTLFDGLSIPDKGQMADIPTIEEPIYCLLENDCLISGCSVETQRLLTKPDASEHEVRLVIEVDVRVSQARPYNLPFLGE